MLLSTAASLLKPWPLALIVDSVLGNKPLPSALSWAAGWQRSALLAALALALVGLYAGQSALSAWQSYAAIRIGLNGLVRVRNEMFQWLQRMSLRFHQGRSQGDLIYRLTWDTYAFQTLFQHGVFTFLGASVSLALMLGVMWRLNRPLAALALLMIPLLILSMKFLGRGMNRRSLAAHQADSQVTSTIQQTITSLPLIQSYTREPVEQEHFSQRIGEAYDRRLAQHRWEVSYSLVIAAGFGLTTAGLAWIGAREVMGGRLTVGELLVFFGYLTQLYEPLNQLSHVGATLSDASAGAERVLELLEPGAPGSDRRAQCSAVVRSRGRPEWTASPSRLAASGSSALVVHGNVALEEVTFGYEPAHPVLQQVSLSVAAGESVAIIGPSGAGKTTLLQLLPRFYDPTGGRVLLEGVDLRQLKLKDLRAQIALVPQEPLLLLGTIAENIRYGRPGARADEIELAAQAANADAFIRRLPQGYDTVVGEGAARLARAGEKQRINIARAFLKNAPILILDEPTSALDVESEELVVNSLARLMENRTALLVAHRLSTVRQVNRIAVLDGGHIVECGTPDELLRSNGYYARLAGGAGHPARR